MKHIGLIVIGAAVVAGFAYAIYKTATPNTQNINNVPSSASTSSFAPFNALTYGVGGLTPVTFSGDIANTTQTAQTNPGGF